MSPNTSGWQKQMLGSFRQSKAKSLPQSAMHIMFDEKSQIGSPNQNKVWCVQLQAHAVYAFPIPKHVATIGMMPWKVLAWNLDASVLRTISSARTHESCRNRWRLGSRALIGSKGWQSNRVCLQNEQELLLVGNGYRNIPRQYEYESTTLCSFYLPSRKMKYTAMGWIAADTVWTWLYLVLYIIVHHCLCIGAWAMFKTRISLHRIPLNNLPQYSLTCVLTKPDRHLRKSEAKSLERLWKATDLWKSSRRFDEWRVVVSLFRCFRKWFMEFRWICREFNFKLMMFFYCICYYTDSFWSLP